MSGILLLRFESPDLPEPQVHVGIKLSCFDQCISGLLSLSVRFNLSGYGGIMAKGTSGLPAFRPPNLWTFQWGNFWVELLFRFLLTRILMMSFSVFELPCNYDYKFLTEISFCSVKLSVKWQLGFNLAYLCFQSSDVHQGDGWVCVDVLIRDIAKLDHEVIIWFFWSFWI